MASFANPAAGCFGPAKMTDSDSRIRASSFGQRWPIDPDLVSRAIVPVNVSVVTNGWESIERHQHRKAELIYTVRGVIHCDMEGGRWIVPPRCAVWIPAGLPHSASATGELEYHCLFIDPIGAAALPEHGCTVSISPLLRELLLRAAQVPPNYDRGGRDGRLVSVFLDELAAAPVENLHLPMPAEPRLRKLAELMLSDPADRASLQQWASRVALSERSLSRMLLREIGMSFGQWRRQLHAVTAIQRLTAGESVQTIAIDLGYESASSFVTMFKKLLGKPPGRYLREVAAGPARPKSLDTRAATK